MATGTQKKGVVPFIPNHLLTEASVALFVIGAIMVVAGLWPRELGEPANKLVTPEHIKPEWYFYWMFAALKLIPSKVMGLLLTAIPLGLMVVVPWLDRSKERRPSRRPLAAGIMAGLLVILVIMSYIGGR